MKKCFIICPIGDDGTEIRKQADESLEFVIEPACKKKGYNVIRSDKISDNGMITQSIIENILQCDLAIADLTNRNPNVFYELAIRHSYGLPVIQITRDDVSDIPFDIHNMRTIQYDLSASGAKRASEEIEKVIDSIENGTKTLNPVTSVAGILNLSQGNTNTRDDTLYELLMKVNGIPEKLNELENNIGARFTQMLTAFGETINVGTQSQSLQDIFLGKLFETMMNDPQKGINQMQNLMQVQKFMDQNGLTSGDNNE